MAKLPRYTKRDFEFVASAVRLALQGLEAVAADEKQKATLRRAVAVVAAALAMKFRESNPMFREGQFLSACGLKWPDEYDRSPFHYLEKPDEFWRASWKWLAEN
jgi:hypothetical protein